MGAKRPFSPSVSLYLAAGQVGVPQCGSYAAYQQPSCALAQWLAGRQRLASFWSLQRAPSLPSLPAVGAGCHYCCCH